MDNDQEPNTDEHRARNTERPTNGVAKAPRTKQQQEPLVIRDRQRPSPAHSTVPGEAGRDEGPGEELAMRHRVRHLEEEVQRLRPMERENERLKRCMGGVKVLGRALKQAKSEVEELKSKTVIGADSYVTSRETDVSNDTEDPDQEALSNELDTILPPTNCSVAESPKDLPAGRETEKSPGKHEDRHVCGDETQGGTEKRTEHRQHQTDDNADDVEPGVEGSDDHRRQVASVEDAEGVPDIQAKAVGLTEAMTVPVASAEEVPWPTGGPDAGRRGGGEMVEGSRTTTTTAPQTNREGVRVSPSRQWLQNDELAAVEAALTKESPPTQTDESQTSSRGRSDVTINDLEDSFARQAFLIDKLEKSGLQERVVELRKVNLDWEKFWKKKKSEHVSLLRGMQTTNAELERKVNDAAVEASKTAMHYQQLLHSMTEHRDTALEKGQQLQSELDLERERNDKTDQLNRVLAKQNMNMTGEIKRLKEALERKHRQALSSPRKPVSSSPPMRYQAPNEKLDTENSEVPPGPSSPPSQLQGTVRGAKSPPAFWQPLPLTVPPPDTVPSETVAGWTTESKKAATVSRPGEGTQAGDHGTPTPSSAHVIKGAAEKSLGKHELKEQIELLRQQNQMFESDFKKEKSDRNRAIDEMQILRHELSRRKGNLQGHGPRHLKPEVAPSTEVTGPHQLYKRSSDHRENPLKISRRSGSEQKAAGQHVYINGNEVAVAQLENVTCEFGKPNMNTVTISTTEPEGIHVLNLGGRGVVELGSKERNLEPFQCPRCQKLFLGSEWESYEHHVTLCKF